MAPSILGLRPGGVERLGVSLMNAGLAKLPQSNSIKTVHAPNKLYSGQRDKNTGCLNSELIREYSIALATEVSKNRATGLLVLGGDCSILLGILIGLKHSGSYGLIFLDAHADFYAPEQSPTGEVADMDLAIATGRGPATLSNINNLKPYVEERNVIHIGQRDGEEAKHYGCTDIRQTGINCFDLASIRRSDIRLTAIKVIEEIMCREVGGFWIHFDTDVLNDDENPAVDYRIPGGLTIPEVTHLLKALLGTNRIAGMSVTIYNADLDPSGNVANKIAKCITESFQ